MTTINGAKHDVEDILASIRTSIADRSPFDLDRRDTHVTTLRGRSVIAEEAVEFELPAIFKASAQPAPERPNLLGRLSEALSSSGHQEWERSRTVIPFEPAHGRMIEPPPVVLQAVHETPATIADKVAAENDSVKRIMPTFFDTRINRMSETSHVVHEVRSEPVAKPVVAEASHPPRLPVGASEGASNGAVEDVAAQLLRPILKQWLTENMPKIVEKALRSESGDDEPKGSSRS